MGIADELAAAGSRPGPVCRVCLWLEGRTSADREEWEKGMRVYGKIILHRVMQTYGFDGSVNSIQRHQAKHLS